MKHDFKVGDLVKIPHSKSTGCTFDDEEFQMNLGSSMFNYGIVAHSTPHITVSFATFSNGDNNWDFLPEDLEHYELIENYEIF